MSSCVRLRNRGDVLDRVSENMTEIICVGKVEISKAVKFAGQNLEFATPNFKKFQYPSMLRLIFVNVKEGEHLGSVLHGRERQWRSPERPCRNRAESERLATKRPSHHRRNQNQMQRNAV